MNDSLSVSLKWVKELPENWKIIRIKNCLLNGREGSKIGPFGSSLKLDEMIEEGFKVYGQENIISNNFVVGKRHLTQAKFNEMESYSISPDDILITMMGTIGQCQIVPADVKPGIFDSHLLRLRFKQDHVNLLYFKWVFGEAAISKEQVEIFSKGSIMSGLNSGIVKAMYIPLPPLEVQKTIAKFLDRKTATIDALIAKKQRLIELLEEKRSALINQAVTKGLNPDAPMKDSGIPWIGEIPSHWRVMRLKFLTTHITSGSRGWAEFYSDEGAIFLRITNLSRKSIELNLKEIQYVQPPSGAEGERSRVKSGDLLISITAYIGTVNVVSQDLGEAYVNQHVALTRPRKDFVDSEWLALCLFSSIGQQQFNSFLYGSTKDGLGLDDIKNLIALVPPLREQKIIVSFLKQEASRVDKLIHKISIQIEKLQEYRQSVITAAVTGKLDVTQASAP